MSTLGGCCNTERVRTDEIFDAVEARTLVFGDNASVLGSFRQSIEALPEAQELVSFGDCAGEVAAQRIGRGASAVSDETAALCAFVIERTGYHDGLEALRAFLLSQPGASHHVWSSDFVIRALLVLRGLADPSGGYERYDEASFQRALDGR